MFAKSAQMFTAFFLFFLLNTAFALPAPAPAGGHAIKPTPNIPAMPKAPAPIPAPEPASPLDLTSTSASSGGSPLDILGGGKTSASSASSESGISGLGSLGSLTSLGSTLGLKRAFLFVRDLERRAPKAAKTISSAVLDRAAGEPLIKRAERFQLRMARAAATEAAT